MTTSTRQHEHFEGIVEDHRRLRELLGLIGESFSGRDRNVHRLMSLLVDLEGDLLAHFEYEEHGGYLEEALALAPHFSNRAARLVSEHNQFLRMVREMHDGVGESAWEWEIVRDQFRTFAYRFLNHESEENRLVQDAMLRDIEAED
jgi:hypothetical protein